MTDVLVLTIAWPSHVGFIWPQRGTYGMQSLYEFAIGAERLQDFCSYARHDVHVDNDVRRIADFNTNLGDRGADRAHRIWNNVHRAAGHRTRKKLGQPPFHPNRVFPVIVRTGLFFGFGTNKSSVFYACDIEGGR